jgi:hypothetical protein
LGELAAGHRRGVCHALADADCGEAERPGDGGTCCDGLQTLHSKPLRTLVNELRLRSTPTWFKVIAGQPDAGFIAYF